MSRALQLGSFARPAFALRFAPSALAAQRKATAQLASPSTSSMSSSLNGVSEVATPGGAAGSTLLNLFPSPDNEALPAAVTPLVRRSLRRALLNTPVPALALAQERSTSEQAPYHPSDKGATVAAFGAPVGEITAGANGQFVDSPTTPQQKVTPRTRKSSASPSPAKKEAVRAVKKSRILNGAVTPPVTPAVVRKEIGALSTLPVPHSLLDEEVMQTAIEHLRTADTGLAAIIEQHSLASYTSRQPISPFKALVQSIVYQQLAGTAASAIHGRLVDLLGGPDCVTPDCLLGVDVEQLRTVGLSYRKASYVQDLSSHFRSGALSDEALLTMEDAQLLPALTAVKGIGEWTAHMFMMFSLHRPDVLPTGDLAVRKGFQKVFGLSGLPTPQKMEELAEPWRPYRSVGSLYMWKLQDTSVPTATQQPNEA